MKKLWLGVGMMAFCVSVAQAKTVEVSIANMEFVPQSVSIEMGDTVKWVNNDQVPHVVVLDSGKSPQLSPGSEFEYTFFLEGNFDYTCDLHPSMKGTIVVAGEEMNNAAPLTPTNNGGEPVAGEELNHLLQNLGGETSGAGGDISAQNNGVSIPGLTETYSVVNVSRDNQSTEDVVSRPGDILRYEFKIVSETADVVDYVAQIDITDILAKGNIIDSGLGSLQGNTLVFPPFTQAAPCQHIFSFFVEVKDCTGPQAIHSNANGNGSNVSLQCALVPAGGSSLWIIGIAGMILLIMGMVVARRRA